MHQPELSDYGLTQERYQELKRAFGGANTLLWLAVFLGMTLGFYLAIDDKVEGFGLKFGLLLMCALTGLLLMLFLSGLLKIVLTVIFKRIYPDFVAVQRYDLAHRDRR